MAVGQLLAGLRVFARAEKAPGFGEQLLGPGRVPLGTLASGSTLDESPGSRDGQAVKEGAAHLVLVFTLSSTVMGVWLFCLTARGRHEGATPAAQNAPPSDTMPPPGRATK